MTINYVNFGRSNNDDWEDEPYTAPKQPAPMPAQKPSMPQDTTSPAGNKGGSSYVSMEVDNGLLPVRFEFNPQWQFYVSPNEVGRELYQAYRDAVNRHITRLSEAAGGKLGVDYPHSHFLPRRQQLILLLEAETWEEYSHLKDELFASARYRAHGQATDNDEPVMIISGDREAIRAIHVWQQWWGCADPLALEAEILTCVAKIRSAQPKFVSAQRDWSRYTDDQLFELKNQHRRRLIESTGQ
ncbi:hypothetical protein HLB23_39485 [Nocardia uniformis]|uniref:Uncharacterized protein n=1 Tax=Nocardia uniformis TaxID=53432 RepID=A0A849CKW4_9NOCA|nr:hypothetical protein [Nocardia uniformis]NNH75871.1 hypothetical protein [Nocardia uniformis]